MLKKILIGLGAVVVIFLVIVVMQPNEFSLSRSIVINAMPTEVFSHVNDFHQWEHWSPWAKIDPSMKATYEGPASGEGASYSWIGNNQVGEGRMTITKSQPAELIHINLEFIKPFQATNLTVFEFKSEGQGTSVIWTMSGKNNFMAKAMCLFMSMEKMVGPDFEKGLAQMKMAVEKKS